MGVRGDGARIRLGSHGGYGCDGRAVRSRYENGTYAVIVRDDVPLVDELGRYVTTGSLGTMLPLSGGSGILAEAAGPCA